MEKAYLKIEEGTICYYRFGQGPNLLIALHGFGDQGRSFSAFEKTLGHHFTIIALDLPFHGETEWLAEAYKREDLINWVEQVLNLGSWKKFDLVGHSLGGTIALSIASNFKGTLQNLFLLAPGGVAVKDMAIPSLIPIRIRQWIAKKLKAGFILKLANTFVKWKLVSAYSNKFLQHHFGSSEKQNRLMQTWVSEYYFRLNLSSVKENLKRREKSKTHILLGRKDPLISMEAINRELNEFAEIHYLEGGHRLINTTTAEYLKQWITI